MITYVLSDTALSETDPTKLPSNSEVFTHILFFMLCEDFVFYWSHRFLHWEKIYPYIHKVHHRFNNSVSIASEYSHPIEFFITIVASSSGSIILGKTGHLLTYQLWQIIRITEAADGHCGYEFSWSPFRLLPFSGSSEYHNYHHINYKGNYCSLFTYWDRICGTVNPNYLKIQNNKILEKNVNQ